MKPIYTVAIVLSFGLLAVVVALYTNYPAALAFKSMKECEQAHGMTSLCNGTAINAAGKKQPQNSDCHAAGYEQCLIDYRHADGSFCYAVRNPSCDTHKNTPPAPTPTPTPISLPSPTPTMTPTPTPTPTPTCTPTPGPTATPTPTSTPYPTATPAPPQVLAAETPPTLPPTGFPTDALASGALISGSIGWFLVRRFRA